MSEYLVPSELPADQVLIEFNTFQHSLAISRPDMDPECLLGIKFNKYIPQILGALALRGPGTYSLHEITDELNTFGIGPESYRSTAIILQYATKYLPSDVLRTAKGPDGVQVINDQQLVVAMSLPGEDDETAAKHNLEIGAQQQADVLLRRQELETEQIQRYLVEQDKKKIDLTRYDHLEVSQNEKKYTLLLGDAEDRLAARLIGELGVYKKSKRRFTPTQLADSVWQSMPIIERCTFGSELSLNAPSDDDKYMRMVYIVLNSILKSPIGGGIQLISADESRYHFSIRRYRFGKASSPCTLTLRLGEREGDQYSEIAIGRYVESTATRRKRQWAMVTGPTEETSTEVEPFSDKETTFLYDILTRPNRHITHVEAIAILDLTMGARRQGSLTLFAENEGVAIEALIEELHQKASTSLGSAAYSVALENRMIGRHAFHGYSTLHKAKIARDSK